MGEAKKYILVIISLGLLPGGYAIGETYIGSFWGDIIFISSGSFLFLFSVLNTIKAKEIENKTIETSKIKYIDVIIVLYFLIYVALYIVKSFKPPSSFLICLFFIYLILTFTWILVFENKKISIISSLLLLLALLPLVIGLVSIPEENSIKYSIETLTGSTVYYEDNLDNITNGILTKDKAFDIRYNIQLLKSHLDNAEKDYLSGDLTGSEKEIKQAKEKDNILKDYFKLLDPQRAIFDMLQNRDKTIDRLDSEARNIPVNSNYSYCEKIEVEQIMVDINITRAKLNESWSEYRKGDYQISYNVIKDIDKNITDIEEQIQRCNLFPPPSRVNDIPLIIVFLLIVILSILSKRRQK